MSTLKNLIGDIRESLKKSLIRSPEMILHMDNINRGQFKGFYYYTTHERYPQLNVIITCPQKLSDQITGKIIGNQFINSESLIPEALLGTKYIIISHTYRKVHCSNNHRSIEIKIEYKAGC